MTGMKQTEAGSVPSRSSQCPAPHGVELRHLRYFVAVADAGTFTQAAELMFIAQPTLSQQVRRLEEMLGTPLLQRQREGVRLTKAGTVLLEESRAILSLVQHGVSRTRHAAGLGRPRLRVVMPRTRRRPLPCRPRRSCWPRPLPPTLTWCGWRPHLTPSSP